MMYSLVFSLLLMFSAVPDSKKESPKVKASFCNLPDGEVRISDFADCGGVTLTIDPRFEEKYKDAKVVSFTFVFSPKAGGTPPAVENVTGDRISINGHEWISRTKPGDLIILANVKIQTGKGIENLKGVAYNIVAE